MELTTVQKEILQELIAIYEEKNDAVKGTEIAKRINRNPGTIRNQMQSLRALNLVDGVPGPKGGYVPTYQAYRSLGLISDENEINIPIIKNGELVEGVYVEKIIFDTVAHEKSCSSMIHIKGNTKLFNIGDKVKIGPTYHNKITVIGTISGRDDIHHILLINVIGVIGIPNISINQILKNQEIICITSDETIQKAAELLCKYDIHGLPVINNKKDLILKGIITLHNIAKTVANNNENKIVKEVMENKVITCNPDEKIYKCIEKMDKYNVGRLIITNENNKIVGIITRTDILKLLKGEDL